MAGEIYSAATLVSFSVSVADFIINLFLKLARISLTEVTLLSGV